MDCFDELFRPGASQVLHANGKSEDSLRELEHAMAVPPRNPLAQYKKAGVLLSLERYQVDTQSSFRASAKSTLVRSVAHNPILSNRKLWSAFWS